MIVQRIVEEQQKGKYDFLAREYGALFNTIAWTDLFGKRLERYGFYENDGELVGGFCIYRDRKLGLPILRNPPFTCSCGPFLKVRAKNSVAVMETWRKALTVMAEFIEGLKYAVLHLPLDRQITDTLPFFWKGFKVVPSYTYFMDLRRPIEDLHSGMVSKRRNAISKATRDGLVARQVEDLTVMHDLVLATFGRQAKRLDEESLRRILFQYATPGNSFAFATYRGEAPIAGSFFVHTGKTAYLLLAGYREAEKHRGAGALALFEGIRHAQHIGISLLDFEGSIIPPIEEFFRGFGGTLTPYFTISKAWLPIEMALKLKYRAFF